MSVGRSALDVENSAPRGAVFLSYASQDAEAVRRIAEALRAAGVEVWFDQNELVGGDAWDQKIRGQIKECALFVPIISAATQARTEGYFRLEWRLADQRTHLMAKGRPFLLPVVIDDTRDAGAHVPDSFTEVQWTRVAGDEAVAAFATRVKKLLSGERGAGSQEPEARRSRPAARDESFASPVRAKSKPIWLWAVLGFIALGTAYFIFKPRRSPEEIAKIIADARALAATANKPVAAPLSEARKLVAQAYELFDEGDEANPENLFLAEDLLKKAQALDSTDAEVWAAQAHVSRLMTIVGYDMSASRRVLLQKQAERAVKLDAKSIEAQIAYAEFLTDATGASALEGARLLQELEARNPAHHGLLHALGLAYSVSGKPVESAAAFDRANALPGGDARALAEKGAQMVWYGRYAEAETALAGSLALKSTGRAHVFGTMMILCWRGDLAAAAASLEHWPAWLRLVPRGALISSQVWLWRHEPDKAIAVLNAVPRDSWNDVFFTGPKAVLLALAHEMAGRPQAARAEWENTLKAANRMLAEDPMLKEALAYKACALARLDETAAAEALLHELEQSQSLRAEFWSSAPPSALLRIAVGRGFEVPAKFDTERRVSAIKMVFPSPQAALRLNPVFDPIRATPVFQKWLAAAPAPATKQAGGVSAQNAAPAPPLDEKSVAVLAFANLSDDKANEYFSDGIADELLTTLQKIPGLKVSTHTSAWSFKGKNATSQEIGEKLHVAHIVEGSVQKSGNRVKITARLSRAATNEEIWSKSFGPIKLTDVFATQSELAQAIVAELRGRLGDPVASSEIQAQVQAATRGGTKNVEAHQLYLQGKFLVNQNSVESAIRGIGLLRRAVEIDP